MRIAIASGKGGTGKTTVSVALALCAEQPVTLLDCDVEEPNCHIFIPPAMQHKQPVSVLVPSVDETKCTDCGECGRFCQYHAIVSLKTKPLVFPELCHSCGGCAKVCPAGAIQEVPREIGVLEIGQWNHIRFIQGRLNIGEAMAPPLIRAVKEHIPFEGLTLLDCPPGTSCPVITAVKGCDYVILVTEPTPFGLHDLTLAVDTMRELKLPFGVILNRANACDDRVTHYCRQEKIPILLQIPDDRKIAAAYSCGQTLFEAAPDLRIPFQRLLQDRLCPRTPSGNQIP